MDAGSDCEVKDKEKLQAVVTSFDQVSFLKLIYNMYMVSSYSYYDLEPAVFK